MTAPSCCFESSVSLSEAYVFKHFVGRISRHAPNAKPCRALIFASPPLGARTRAEASQRTPPGPGRLRRGLLRRPEGGAAPGGGAGASHGRGPHLQGLQGWGRCQSFGIAQRRCSDFFQKVLATSVFFGWRWFERKFSSTWRNTTVNLEAVEIARVWGRRHSGCLNLLLLHWKGSCLEFRGCL